MKLKTIPLIITILFGLLILAKPDKKREDYLSKEKAPDDWFFRQRAFPSGKIPQEKYHSALKKVRQMKKALSQKEEEMIWEFAGPANVGGRLTDVEVCSDDMNTLFAGAASGGIFKSEDGGETWTPVFDDALSLSIGDIALAPSDNNIIYVGTGEANAGGGSLTYDGVGVYKSVDGGNSWSYAGLPHSGSIGRIAINPGNPDVVYVAAMGSLFADSPDRGVYRSQDGGATWENVLFVSDSTGAIDIVINPANPAVVYAAMWERMRRPDRRNYGGPTCGIYKSVNGGDTWIKLEGGLPGSDIGRIGIDIAKSNPDILYAIYADETGYFKGIYKTTDGGTTWERADHGEINYLSYGWWFGRIKIDPVNYNIVYAIAFELYKTANGGAYWSAIGVDTLHVDQHELFIHPVYHNYLAAANDGGLYLSYDGGLSWSKKNNLPITQFYTCEVDRQFPERLYGGTQDNGTNRTMSGNTNDWEKIYYGDGFYVRVDPLDNNYIYAESQRGNFVRSVDGGNTFYPAMNGIGSDDRFNWNTPFVIDPSNHEILYLGSNKVYKTTDRAGTWTAVSNDLTNGPGTGNLTYGTITTIDVSPLNPAIVYAGTDDGNVWVTTGSTWQKVSEQLPGRWVTRVVADIHSEDRAYVTLSGYRYDDYLPHVFMTEDKGMHWIDISGDLPEVPVNDLVIDPEYDSVLYVATDAGVFVTRNLGSNWNIMGTNLPTVVVSDLTLHNDTRKLVAATYGRSMYTYDLYQDTIITRTKQIPVNNNISALAVFPNPFHSYVTITFESEAVQKGKIEVYDISGKYVATLFDGNFKKGGNRFRWVPENEKGKTFIVTISTGNKITTKKILRGI